MRTLLISVIFLSGNVAWSQPEKLKLPNTAPTAAGSPGEALSKSPNGQSLPLKIELTAKKDSEPFDWGSILAQVLGSLPTALVAAITAMWVANVAIKQIQLKARMDLQLSKLESVLEQAMAFAIAAGDADAKRRLWHEATPNGADSAKIHSDYMTAYDSQAAEYFLLRKSLAHAMVHLSHYMIEHCRSLMTAATEIIDDHANIDVEAYGSRAFKAYDAQLQQFLREAMAEADRISPHRPKSAHAAGL